MKNIIQTFRQPITALYTVREVSRELRIPARMAAMMVACDKTLHDVVTDTTYAILLDGTETRISTVEQQCDEVKQAEVAAIQLQDIFAQQQAALSAAGMQLQEPQQ